jgi:biotin carboxyl carrier protein
MLAIVKTIQVKAMKSQNQPIAQVNNAPANNNHTAIATTPTPTPDASNTIPAIVSNPTVSIILAFAVLVRVIISGKK